MRPAIVIGSPHPLIAAGLACVLRESGYGIARQTYTVESLVDAVSQERPRIVVMDYTMVGDAMSTMGELAPYGSTVIVMADPLWDGRIGNQAMRAGAMGYLSINDSLQQFLESIDLLVQGAIVVSPDLGDLMWNHAPAGKGEKAKTLEDEDRKLLLLLAQGATNKQIALELGMNESVIEENLHIILMRLGLNDRYDIASYAARNDLLEIDSSGNGKGGPDGA